MNSVPQGAIDAAFNQAVESYHAGKLRDAMRILQFLTLLAPTDRGVWRALARCHEDAGEIELAENLRWLGHSLAEGST